MSNNFEEYFGAAGDMASGSQNPAEQNDWFDKQQKELERQKKALERQQTLAKPGRPLHRPSNRPDPRFRPGNGHAQERAFENRTP